LHNFFWLLILCASFYLPAETGKTAAGFDDLHTRLIRAVAQADDDLASRLFDEAARLFPEAYTAFNYAYLEGRRHLQAGDLAAASAQFLESADSGERLADYALMALSGLALERGEPSRCDEYLNRLLSACPESLHRREAFSMLAENAFGRGDFERATAYMDGLIQEEGAGGARHTRYRLAGYHLEAGGTEAGAEILGRLIEETQNDDLAWQSLESLETLEAGGRADRPGETDTLYKRGLVCYYNRKFTRAIAYFRAALPGAGRTADLLKINYQLGKAHFRLGQYGEAIPVFSWIEARDHRNLWKSKCRYMAGRSRQMNEDMAGAGRSFIQVIDLADDPVLTASAALRLSRFPEEIITRDRKTALLARLVEQLKPLQEKRKLALRLAEMAVEAGQPDRAYATLEKVSGSEGRGWQEIQFRMARLAGRLGRADEALALYGGIIESSPRHFYRFAAEKAMLQSMPDPDDYLRQALYSAGAMIESGNTAEARRLLSRLPLFSLPPVYQRPAAAVLRVCYESEEAYQAGLTLDSDRLAEAASGAPGAAPELEKLSRALAFLRLGLIPEAARELDHHLTDGGDDPALLLSGAGVLLRGGRPASAIRQAGRVASRLPKDYQPLLFPEPLLDLLYPFHFREDVNKFAGLRQIDPLFVLAVIREESRFDPGVRSGAAAKGLMQFIPETAAAVAASAGLTGFEEEHLYDPSVSINLGTKHLSDLLKKYGGDHYRVLSAYNAGPSKTDYWQKNVAGDDPLSFLLSIQFSETRRYIEKVMASYYLYRFIYREPSA
jgi:soluble lytic murein transglycosylase